MATLTLAQLQAFKTAINGEAALAAARTAGDHGAIATFYNAPGSGNVWRPAITAAELNTAIIWSAFVALTAIRQNGYLAMLAAPTIDATKQNIRDGFTAIFGAGTSLTNLTALAQRVPTRFEALFAVSSVTPVFGQVVTPTDVAEALGS